MEFSWNCKQTQRQRVGEINENQCKVIVDRKKNSFKMSKNLSILLRTDTPTINIANICNAKRNPNYKRFDGLARRLIFFASVAFATKINDTHAAFYIDAFIRWHIIILRLIKM